jgi:hypothetical protein
MKASDLNFLLPLSFNQVIELVKQLPFHEKRKLAEVLKKEGQHYPESEEILSHLASENVLAKDWLSTEEDEAWKDL